MSANHRRPIEERRKFRRTLSLAVTAFFLAQMTAASAGAYDLGTTVADMTLAAAHSGGTSCPQLTRVDVSTPGSISRQWSTSLGTSPATILTADQTADGQLNELEAVIQQSLSAWTGVPGSLLTPPTLGFLQRTPAAGACASDDGLNSICFDQNDPAFTLGVLAFTRVVSADTVGQQLSSLTPPSTFVGEILDADVLLRPGDPGTKFATPAALSANPNAYDLESILTHELGHSFGFNHSGVWGAIMFPFAPAPGEIAGSRPTEGSPDAPLSDDDRTGLRVLYPDPSDSLHIGSIRGRVLPANVLALPISPAGVSGIFPAQVVALDHATGTVTAAVLAGWSCSDPGPAQFDGTFSLQRLQVGAAQSYEIYAEPLDGPVTLGSVIENLMTLCRNAVTDPGWPAQYACTVPALAAPFSARMRPGP
jgi:Matrixin